MHSYVIFYEKDNEHEIYFPVQLGGLRGQMASVKMQIPLILMKIKTYLLGTK